MTLHHELAQLIGDDCIVTPEDLARYESGYRYGGGKAAAVVRPRDVEGVRRLVRYAVAHGRRLVVQGAHTGLVGAATPRLDGDQIVLSLERLRGIVLEPLNRSATCGAGALLSALNTAAQTHNLCLPIDLGADPSLGGMAATNTGGARLLRYGGMREQILGIEAVLLDAEASVIGDLHGLRKNNVGIDVKQLLTGSGGKVGIITRVQVELQPVVRQSTTAIVVPAELGRIPAIVAHLEQRLDQLLLACEGMSANAIGAALDSHPALNRPFRALPPYALLVEAGTPMGPASGLNVQALLETVLGELLEDETPAILNAVMGRGNDFWALRHAISDGLKSLGRVVGFDISVRRDRLFDMRRALLEDLTAGFSEFRVCDFGHVADGGMHFNMIVPADASEETISSLRHRVYAIVADYHGSFSAEHGVGPANRAFYELYRPETERAFASKIEALGDPQGLLHRA
jgi:FAD/FMN-containing dehydrogenase